MQTHSQVLSADLYFVIFLL